MKYTKITEQKVTGRHQCTVSSMQQLAVCRAVQRCILCSVQTHHLLYSLRVACQHSLIQLQNKFLSAPDIDLPAKLDGG